MSYIYICISVYIQIYTWNESHALDHSGCAPRCGFRRELPTSSPWSLPQPSLLPGYRSMPHVTWGPNSSSLIFQCTSPVSGHPHSVFHRKLGIEVDWSWLSSISSCPSNLILDDFNRTSWASHRDPWDLCRAAISNKPSWLFNTFTPPTWWMMDGQPKRWPKTRGGQPISVVSTLLCYVNLIAFILHIYIIYIYIIIYT